VCAQAEGNAAGACGLLDPGTVHLPVPAAQLSQVGEVLSSTRELLTLLLGAQLVFGDAAMEECGVLRCCGVARCRGSAAGIGPWRSGVFLPSVQHGCTNQVLQALSTRRRRWRERHGVQEEAPRRVLHPGNPGCFGRLSPPLRACSDAVRAGGVSARRSIRNKGQCRMRQEQRCEACECVGLPHRLRHEMRNELAHVAGRRQQGAAPVIAERAIGLCSSSLRQRQCAPVHSRSICGAPVLVQQARVCFCGLGAAWVQVEGSPKRLPRGTRRARVMRRAQEPCIRHKGVGVLLRHARRAAGFSPGGACGRRLGCALLPRPAAQARGGARGTRRAQLHCQAAARSQAPGAGPPGIRALLQRRSPRPAAARREHARRRER